MILFSCLNIKLYLLFHSVNHNIRKLSTFLFIIQLEKCLEIKWKCFNCTLCNIFFNLNLLQKLWQKNLMFVSKTNRNKTQTDLYILICLIIFNKEIWSQDIICLWFALHTNGNLYTFPRKHWNFYKVIPNIIPNIRNS